MRSQKDYASAQTEKFIAMDIVEPAINFSALANSMGMAAQKVTQIIDIQATVARAIASGEPNLIEIVVSAEELE